jgi:hypothetical protein
MQAIVIQSFIAELPPAIWRALFERADVLFDALPPDRWPEERDEQPPLHVRVAWPWTPAPTDVSVTLRELGGGTRVDVRHTGWGEAGEWEEPLQGHFAGWLQGLAALGLLLEAGVDVRPDGELRRRERYFISGEIPALAAPVWRALADPEVVERFSDGRFDGAERVVELEDRYVRWRWPDGREVAAIVRPTPRGTHLALAEFGADRSASQRWPPWFESLTRFLV